MKNINFDLKSEIVFKYSQTHCSHMQNYRRQKQFLSRFHFESEVLHYLPVTEIKIILNYIMLDQMTFLAIQDASQKPLKKRFWDTL